MADVNSERVHAPVILDCTIRDGSYAIDFKFTAADSALVAGKLDAAGIRWIEVGHGLGLGASEAGKGTAGSSDLEVVERSRASVRDAQVGAFYIPGIGKPSQLKQAAEAGLQFVRIGNNADEMHTAWPAVEEAREAGLVVFVNLMKTYGVSPAAFAESAVRAHELGARGVYVVDSAGGMMPAEVAGYVRAARAEAPIDVGFHGHSNLHLAVANSLAAYEAGAVFVDTSVYGIGRSSGNVPTEVMAAVFQRLGIETGIDPLDIIDLAESYLRPLAEHLHPHDMTAVSLGLGRFHSSFLPQALRAAQEHEISPFRLIAELGARDPMRLSPELLAAVVAELEGQAPPAVQPDLARYSDARFGPRRISNRRQAVQELLDGLEVVAAKRHLAVALDLVSAPALEEDALTAEFVLEDDHMALGRVRFGSLEAAGQALQRIGGRLDAVLVDLDPLPAGERSAALAAADREFAGPVIPYQGGRLELEYLGDAAIAALSRGAIDRVALLDPGVYPADAVAALAAKLGALVPVVRAPFEARQDGAALVVVAGPPPRGQDDLPIATELLLAIGGGDPSPDPDVPERVILARADAYRDRLPGWLRSAALGQAAAATRRVH